MDQEHEVERETTVTEKVDSDGNHERSVETETSVESKTSGLPPTDESKVVTT